MSKLYEADFYTWALTQADAVKRRSANELDWDNLAEELAALGRSELRELHSRYVVLLVHLLKWAHQPGRRSKSWINSISVARRAIEKLLRDSPGLQPAELDEFLDAYESARLTAAAETHLPVDAFPTTPAFTIEQAKGADWLPD